MKKIESLTSCDLGFDQESIKKYFEDRYQMTFSYDKYFEYLHNTEIISLEQEQIDEIFGITKKIDEIFLEAYNYYFEEIEKHFTGEYECFTPYLQKTFPREKYCIARYDVLLEKDTGDLKFIEINANTPGLITDISDISREFLPKGYENINAGFEGYIQNFFAKFQNKKIGILLPHSFEDEDFLIGKSYQKMLEKIFPKENIILGDIYESHILYDREFTLKGEKIDVILNFFPFEFFLTDMDFAKKFLNCLSEGTLQVFNPLESLVLQDKKMFSIIWKNLHRFSPENQKIIQKHLPYSLDDFPENDSDFLAKVRFGRMGRGVFADNFYTHIEKKDDFIFQKKVDSHHIDEKGKYLLLGIFSDLKDQKAIIARTQSALITSDDLNNNKIILVYKK